MWLLSKEHCHRFFCFCFTIILLLWNVVTKIHNVVLCHFATLFSIHSFLFFSFLFFEVQNFLIRLKDFLRLSMSSLWGQGSSVRITETSHAPPSQKFENMSAKLWGGSTWLNFDIRVWKGQHKYTNCLNWIIPMIIYHGITTNSMCLNIEFYKILYFGPYRRGSVKIII